MSNNIEMALENEYEHERLLILAAQHVKLALEFSQKGTSMERKGMIKKEVQSLRTERDQLLNTMKTK